MSDNGNDSGDIERELQRDMDREREFWMSDNDKLIAEARAKVNEARAMLHTRGWPTLADELLVAVDPVFAALEVSRVRTPTETAEHNCSDPRAGSLRLDDRGCCFWCGEAVTPVTPAEREAEAIARLIDPEKWRDSPAGRPFPDDAEKQAEFERNYEAATWAFRKPSLEAAGRILAAGFSRRSPVETEDNWEWMVRNTIPVLLFRTWDTDPTDEETARAIAADGRDGIDCQLFHRRPAGPWLPVTEEKK